MHFFWPSSLLQKVTNCAFDMHHAVPKPLISLSSHTGGGAHRVAVSHSSLQIFLFFLQCFCDESFLHSLHLVLHSPLQSSKSGKHGAGGNGNGDGLEGSGGGEGGGLGEAGGGEGDGGGVPGGDGGDAGDGGDHAEPQSPSLQSVTPKAVMRTRLPSNLERRNELCSALRATVCNICCRYVSA